jgi:TPR repeat protein
MEIFCERRRGAFGALGFYGGLLGLLASCANTTSAIKKKPTDAEAVPQMQKACERGDLEGCSDLGRAYVLGIGVTRDEARALALFRKACDGGNLSGCDRLG